MTTSVTSLNGTIQKDETSFTIVGSGVATGVKVTKLTKPAKVPSWSKDMSLEMYTKQLITWTEINEDVPEYMKFHDLIEKLKKNKDIRDCKDMSQNIFSLS